MTNPSPLAKMQLDTLKQMSDRVQQVYGMVERFAATRDPRQAEQLALPMKRAFGRLKREFMGAGLDKLSQLAGSMEIAAGRGGAAHAKGRILREGVGSLRFQIDQEQRKVLQEDKAAQSRAAQAKAAQSPAPGAATPTTPATPADQAGS